MNHNIKTNDYTCFNPYFNNILKKYRIQQNPHNKPSLICSLTTPGKYCINFNKFHTFSFFNKVNTSHILKYCDHYPKSYIFYNQNDYNNQKLEDKNFFVKPKFGSSSNNISYYRGKKHLVGPSKLSFPLVFQEEVQNVKLANNRKYDLRVHVIYVRSKDQISVFYYNNVIRRKTYKEVNGQISKDTIFTNVRDTKKQTEEIIEDYNNPNLLKCLHDANQYIAPLMIKEKSNKDLELLLTGFDIIVDNNDKHWILEINCKPSLYYPREISSMLSKMLEEILIFILLKHLQKEINGINFVKVY